MSRLVVMLMLGLAACSGSTSTSAPVVHTTGADISSIGQHSTYAHANAIEPPGGYERGAISASLMESVRQRIDAELQSKGYTLAENSDLVVRTSTGNRTVLREPTNRAEVTAGIPATKETEGAVVIDIFERASGRQVFHGFAHDDIRNGAVEQRQIATAVGKLLQPLPHAHETVGP